MLFRYRGFRFFFYSNEGLPREPIHVHVQRDGIEAKFWVVPVVRVAYNDGYSARELRELFDVVQSNQALIVRRWNDYFGT